MTDSQRKGTFDLQTFDVAKFDAILAKGLSKGLGTSDSQMCIEAAICQTLGLPHGDDPQCVTASVRQFKICLNDAQWPSPQARAEGLRALGLAQLGSKGVVDSAEFSRHMADKTIRVLIPTLFRELANGRQDWLTAADKCERTGTCASARQAQRVAAAAASRQAQRVAAYAAASAAYAAASAAADAAASAADAAADAADAAAAASAAPRRSFYLTLSASLALETLRELNSPGIALLDHGGK